MKTTKETATKAYARAAAEVDALLEIIRKRMERDAVDCTQATWAHVGTMQDLRHKLAQIAIGQNLDENASEAEESAVLEQEIVTVALERA